MFSVCCFWIFNQTKRWFFFYVNYFWPNLWICIPYGFIKAVNFKIFFSIIMDCIKYNKLSWSCLWILSRKHIQTDPSSYFDDVLFSVGATWTFNKYNNIKQSVFRAFVDAFWRSSNISFLTFALAVTTADHLPPSRNRIADRTYAPPFRKKGGGESHLTSGDWNYYEYLIKW